MYYIYAIRGKWSPVVKIGYYVADIVELRKRYSTPYGSDLDVRVFEVANKKYAIMVEKSIHATLKKAGYHVINELFKVECIDLFQSRASLLTRRYVTLRDGRRAELRKQRVIQKQQSLQEAKNKHQKTEIQKEAQLSSFIAESCTIDKGLSVNAAAFLQAFNTHTSSHIRQKNMKDFMATRGFKYGTNGSLYKGLTFNAAIKDGSDNCNAC